MRNPLLAVLALLVLSCNPVKQVTKSEKKTQKVVDFYLKGYKPSTLPVSIYVKGDTVVIRDTTAVLQIGIDTVTVKDTVYITKTTTKLNTVIKKVTDTVKVTDRLCEARLLAATKLVQDQSYNVKDAETEAKAVRVERNKWRLYFWLLVVALGVMTSAFLYVKLKK